MNHEFVSKIWAYNPTTGEVTRNGEPVRALWYPDKNPDCGYRCQVNNDGANYSYKAENVAWTLLTGQDLPKTHKPQHVNGDKRDNRAHNLYLVIKAERDNDPSIGYHTVIMADTRLARYLYPNGSKTGDTWTCDAPFTLPIWDDDNPIRSRYVAERCRDVYLATGKDIGYKLAPVDIEHFSAWVFANVDPRTTEQFLAQQKIYVL